MEEKSPPLGAAAERASVRRFWISTVALPPVIGLVLFLVAGTVAWPGAWAFLAVSWIAAIAGGLVIPRELAAERGRIPEGFASYDRVLAPLIARALPLATFVVAGLDRRHGWLPALESAWPWLGLTATMAGAALLDWAMASNRFFSGVVRVQRERGHVVAETGPYARIRHPGYAGLALYTLGTPLLLGSAWALIPSGLTVAALVLRTALEDRTLHRELDGYPAYAGRVRFRLLPGIW